MDTIRATEIAADIVDGMLDNDMLASLLSDEGLTVGDAGRTWVVWLNGDRVAVWAGNDIDPDMDSVVEVKIGAKA